MRRIKVDLSLEDIDKANEVWTKVKELIKSTEVKTWSGGNSFIEYHECHHNESPPMPCEIIQKIGL